MKLSLKELLKKDNRKFFMLNFTNSIPKYYQYNTFTEIPL